MEVSMNTKTKAHRTAAAAFPAALIGAFCACASLGSQALGEQYTPGVYEGAAMGFRGAVRALVQVDENGVAGISLSHEDDEEIGGAAMAELLELVLEGNSPEGLDAVSGATESSLGFLAAVDDALAKARTGKSGDTMLD
jgi:uncharacterized protein with FMN-binding domain